MIPWPLPLPDVVEQHIFSFAYAPSPTAPLMHELFELHRVLAPDMSLAAYVHAMCFDLHGFPGYGMLPVPTLLAMARECNRYRECPY